MKKSEEILQQAGISPSFHRLRVLSYMVTHCNHPTVEDIYADLKKEIPSLSKTTIYNTLKLFVEKGLVNSIPDETEMRYDKDGVFHGHFKCEKCNKVFDVPVSRMDFFDLSEGHEIRGIHIFFRGICSSCKGNN
jgi:Fur family transcriptional regulator, peroxide stress response regulator